MIVFVSKLGIMKKILSMCIMTCILSFVAISVSAQNCVACFTATPDTNNSYNINLDATCSNASFGANYSWYVDGNYYTSLPFPYFQIPFVSPGTYSIVMILDDNGCTDTSTQSITISYNCNASFTASPIGINGYSFYPNGNTSPTATYSWDFGDGNTTNQPSGTYIYANSGTYNLCCIVSDTAFGGCADTSCQTITVNGMQSCLALFSHYVDPLGVLYCDGSPSALYNPANFSMTWYLNGVQMQQAASTFFNTTLITSGNYTVKMVLSDANLNPCDSMTQTFFYNGGIINNPNCYPCFNYTNNATLDSVILNAACSIVPVNGSLEWNINGIVFPDPGVPFTQGFANPGTHTVAIFVKDSNNNYCDSMFQFVYTYAPPCSSCLTVTQAPASTSDYIFNGSCSNNAISYLWFVDNNYVFNSSTPQFTYSFSQSGTYNVCLQTIDANNNPCTQSCTTIVVNTPASTLYDIAGRIYNVDNIFSYSPVGANEAKVYLIKLITGGTLDAIDSTLTDSQGMYTFNNKPIDDYRIKVALNTSSPNYAFNIPTYYNSAIMWYDAQVVTLFGNTYTKDIYMSYGVNNGGNGFISGNVFQGANKPTRSSEDITLILIDQTTLTPVAYTKPSSNGNYSFGNLPNGTYRVYGELLNRASIPDNIVINATQSTHTNKNFIYNDIVIQPTSGSLSIKNIEMEKGISIAPNPAQGSFKLYNSKEDRNIQIMDMTGRLIQEFDLKTGQHKQIDCQGWNAGIYLIQENLNGMKSVQKLHVN
jgi:hypothetical protein